MTALAFSVGNCSIKVVSRTLFISTEQFLRRSKAAATTLNPFKLAHGLSCSVKEAIGETHWNHP